MKVASEITKSSLKDKELSFKILKLLEQYSIKCNNWPIGTSLFMQYFDKNLLLKGCCMRGIGSLSFDTVEDVLFCARLFFIGVVVCKWPLGLLMDLLMDFDRLFFEWHIFFLEPSFFEFFDKDDILKISKDFNKILLL